MATGRQYPNNFQAALSTFVIPSTPPFDMAVVNATAESDQGVIMQQYDSQYAALQLGMGAKSIVPVPWSLIHHGGWDSGAGFDLASNTFIGIIGVSSHFMLPTLRTFLSNNIPFPSAELVPSQMLAQFDAIYDARYELSDRSELEAHFSIPDSEQPFVDLDRHMTLPSETQILAAAAASPVAPASPAAAAFTVVVAASSPATAPSPDVGYDPEEVQNILSETDPYVSLFWRSHSGGILHLPTQQRRTSGSDDSSVPASAGMPLAAAVAQGRAYGKFTISVPATWNSVQVAEAIIRAAREPDASSIRDAELLSDRFDSYLKVVATGVTDPRKQIATATTKEVSPGERLNAYLGGILAQDNKQFAKMFGEMIRNVNNAQNIQLSEYPAFGRGVVIGFFQDGLWGNVTGFYQLGKFAWDSFWFLRQYHPGDVAGRYIAGDDFAKEREYAETTREVLEIAWKVNHAVNTLPISEVTRHAEVILNGSVEDLKSLGGQHKQFAAFMMALTVRISKYFGDMDAEMKGRIVGAVTYEIAQTVAEIFLTAGISKLAAGGARFARIADKLSDFGKYSDKFGDVAKTIAKWFDEGGQLRRVLEKFDDGVDLTSKASRWLIGDIQADPRAIKALQESGVPIEQGNSTSRRLLFNQNKYQPDGLSHLRSRNPGNALFHVDEAGNPIIALRRDATRIELMEEVEHYEYFLRWVNERGLKPGPDRSSEWKRFLKDPRNEAMIEMDAHERVMAWLRQNGGTVDEINAVNQRLGAWEEMYRAAGGNNL